VADGRGEDWKGGGRQTGFLSSGKRVRSDRKGQQNPSLAASFRLAARSHWAPGRMDSTSQGLRGQDGGRSRHAERGASNAHSAVSSRSLAKTFIKCNLSRGQLQNVQRMGTKDGSKHTAATDRHGFHKCRSEEETLETDWCGRALGENRGFRLQLKGK